jgi:dUTP pyrophosphatase
MMKMEVKKFDPDAILPVRKTSGAAGYDLFALENMIIQPNNVVGPIDGFSNRKSIRTGIGVSIPSGYYGRIASRSGLSLKFG